MYIVFIHFNIYQGFHSLFSHIWGTSRVRVYFFKKYTGHLHKISIWDLQINQIRHTLLPLLVNIFRRMSVVHKKVKYTTINSKIYRLHTLISPLPSLPVLVILQHQPFIKVVKFQKKSIIIFLII